MVDVSRQALQMIKNQAKSRGLTQAKLAKKLNVSLPTIKRWYGGGTITLNSLERLVNEVGLSLTEVFSSIEKASAETFQYSDDQEKFFSTNPDCLAYFDHLLKGRSPLQIQNKFRLPENRSLQYLGKLDKLKLIEWLPQNKVRLLVKGEPIWKPGGPLALRLRGDILKSFIEKERRADSHFFLHDYLEADRLELVRKIQDLADFAKRANRRAKFRIDETKPSGLFLSLQTFRWDFDQYLSGY